MMDLGSDMLKKYFRHPLLKRCLFSLLMVFIFLLGNHLDVLRMLVGQSDVDNLVSVTAVREGTIGLFTLGLSPWMYAMLLSQVLHFGPKGKRISPKRQQFHKHILMLIIAMIQGLGLTLGQEVDTFSSHYPLFVFLMLSTVVAGSFVVSWLGSMNATYGIGGQMIIILMNLLSSQLKLVPVAIETFQTDLKWHLLAMMLWSVMAMFIMILFERSEYRVPVQRVSINNDLVKDTYLPFRVNLGGGMAMMYAFTFLNFPQYIVTFIRYFFPNRQDLVAWQTWFSIRTLSGIVVYAAMVFTLSIAFAFFNMDTVEQARKMRASGDFIPDVRPGNATSQYLKAIIWRLSSFSGLVITMLVVTPLVFVLGNKILIALSPVTGILMMVAGMFYTVKEEMLTYRLVKNYKAIFKD